MAKQIIYGEEARKALLGLNEYSVCQRLNGHNFHLGA